MQSPNPSRPGVRIDFRHSVDMTDYHTIRFETHKGRVAVSVDGETVIHSFVIQETPLQETWFGHDSADEGDAWIQHVAYRAGNETEPDFHWRWNARSGKFPDQYQIDRMLELQANPPEEQHRPDNGYSSWLQMPDEDIFLLDYSNRGDPPPTSHIYAARFSLADFGG